MTDIASYKTFVPVTDAHAVSTCEVAVTFADGRTGVIDLTGIIGDGPWRRLADPSFFSRAHAAFDTIVWDDDVDVAPEYVYEHTMFDPAWP